jgi:hypothetical protein
MREALDSTCFSGEASKKTRIYQRPFWIHDVLLLPPLAWVLKTTSLAAIIVWTAQAQWWRMQIVLIFQ